MTVSTSLVAKGLGNQTQISVCLTHKVCCDALHGVVDGVPDVNMLFALDHACLVLGLHPACWAKVQVDTEGVLIQGNLLECST